MSKLEHLNEQQKPISSNKTGPIITDNLLQTLQGQVVNFNSENSLVLEHQESHSNLVDQLETPRPAVADIPLGNGESINTSDFLQHIKLYSLKAVNLLPVSEDAKKKVLQEIGIEPFNNNKIREIYKLGRQRISQNNRTNPNVYGECQPKYEDGGFSFIIAMENNAPKKVFLYFLYHEIDHMV